MRKCVTLLKQMLGNLGAQAEEQEISLTSEPREP